MEALHTFDDVVNVPFILAHLYHLLFEIAKGQSFETNLNRVTWMIQIWLQWYFLEFLALNLEFPKGVAIARILVEALTISHSTLFCLYFFKICKTRTDLE